MRPKVLWVVVLGFVMSVGQVAAQTTALEFVPTSQSVTISNSVTVAITISGLGTGVPPSLSVFDLDVTFDPTLLAFSSVTFGDPTLGDELDVLGLGSLAFAIPGVGSVNLFELSFDLPDDLHTLQAGEFILAI